MLTSQGIRNCFFPRHSLAMLVYQTRDSCSRVLKKEATIASKKCAALYLWGEMCQCKILNKAFCYQHFLFMNAIFSAGLHGLVFYLLVHTCCQPGCVWLAHFTDMPYIFSYSGRRLYSIWYIFYLIFPESECNNYYDLCLSHCPRWQHWKCLYIHVW